MTGAAIIHTLFLRLTGLTLAASALWALLVLFAGPAAAADESATELAKQSQNSIANLISVPFQNNFNFNSGSKNAMVYDLNVEPVLPFKLTAGWNLITRTIVPVINQPSLFPGPDTISGSAFGLGNVNPTLYLSPAKPGHIKFLFPE